VSLSVSVSLPLIMRVLFGLLLLGLVGVSADITIFRQGYTGGAAGPNGCTGLNPTDNSTFTLGQCYNVNANTSVIINDCWSNGVWTYSWYQGQDCNPASVGGIVAHGHNINNGSFCNAPDAVIPGYSTWTCSAFTPQSTQTVAVNAYLKITGATNCSGGAVPTTLTIGMCNPIPRPPPATGYAGWTIPNCVNGLATATVYTDSNCQILFNQTTGQQLSFVQPFVYSQAGAASGNGKAIGAPGSSCANTTDAYATYTCPTATTSSSSTGTTGASSPSGTTGASSPSGTTAGSSPSGTTGGSGVTPSGSGASSTTPTPTGTGSSNPTNPPSKSSSTGNTGDAIQTVVGMAALMVPIMAAML
jgi:hypothetical protein